MAKEKKFMTPEIANTKLVGRMKKDVFRGSLCKGVSAD